MQKKTIQRLAAAGVLGVAVVATLVWAGNRDTGASLTYDELLALAGDEAVAASVEEEIESSSGTADGALSRPLKELEAEESSSEEVDSTSADESENTASTSEENASSASSALENETASSSKKPESSSVVTGASHSTAAPERDYSSHSVVSSSHTTSSAAHSTAAGSSHAASASTVKSSDEQLAECIRKIEALQTRSEKELYGIIYDAYDEYMAHPAEERNLMLKISVVLSKGGELTNAQSKCDKEFKNIVTDMRKILRESGRDETLADEAEKTYKQQKNAMIKELTDQAYSGGDGSGQSGKWLAEKAGKLS